MCRQCFSQPSKAILNASSCRSISGQRERHVLYQRLFRLALWETSSSCSSSQLSTWFMETWAISRLATQSSPDKLVPSAHVTVVCFLQPIFIHDNKLNMPCFWGSYFFPSLLLFSMYDLLDNYQRSETDTKEWTSQNSLARLCFSPPILLRVISRFCDGDSVITFNGWELGLDDTFWVPHLSKTRTTYCPNHLI